jgi:hypothetical protein
MQTLVLDQSLQPVNTVSWHRAVGMMLTGSADVLEEYDQLVHPRMQMPAAPASHLDRSRIAL